MTIQIRKATRQKAKMRLGIAAPSGAGKTYGALQLAFGLGGKIGMIDTEHGSGDLYAHLGDYDIISLEAPYEISKYLAAIRAFEESSYSVIIIDSLSHAWAGEGGLLDKQGRIEASSRSKNGYMAWREVTPEHNALVDAMLKSPAHIIATMRSKTAYVLETDERGKQVPRKVGLAPVQRDGMEYEFTVMLDIDHTHHAATSKDRTGLFDKKLFKLSPEIGQELLSWLDTGVDVDAQYQTLMDTFRGRIAGAEDAAAVNALVKDAGAVQHWRDSKAVIWGAIKGRAAELGLMLDGATSIFKAPPAKPAKEEKRKDENLATNPGIIGPCKRQSGPPPGHPAAMTGKEMAKA
jgi:hypothetical protein